MFTTLRRVAVVAVLVIASGSIFAPSAGATPPVTSPADGSTVNAPATVFVIHGFTLDPLGSSITLWDGSSPSAPVDGSTSFTTTTAPNDTIIFTPTSPLTQAASPYSATAIGKAALGGDPPVTTTFTFSVDSTPPAAPTVTSVTDPVNASNQATVSVIGTAEPGSTVSVYIQDGAGNAVLKQVTTGSPGGPSDYSAPLDLTPLNDGTLRVDVSATDAAFNVSPITTRTTFKDSIPPATPGVTIVDNPITATNESAVKISGTSGESGLTIQVSVDDTDALTSPVTGSATTGSGGGWTLNLDLKSLRQGTITASATAKDAGNNLSGTATDIATKETDAPPTISIADTNTVEGSTASVAVTLSYASSQPITVHVASSNGTATTADYTTVVTDLTFAPGETTKQVSVPTTNDTLDELNETVIVTLSAETNATIARGIGVLTIIDNDPAPTISIADGSVTEGSTASVAVTLSTASGRTITVHAASSNGTATAADYTTVSTDLTFNPGETTKQVSVPTTNDTLDEPDETVIVTLSAEANAAVPNRTGVLTITDNDPAPTISIADGSVVEGSTANLTVTLSALSGKTITVHAASSNGTATTADYTTVSTDLTFAPGETTKQVSVPTTNDTLDEPNETVIVTLSAPTNAGIADGTGVVTITDNDPAPANGPDPFGNVDILRVEPGTIHVAGWAIDPDTNSPIDVHIYVGTTGYARTANLDRPDVDAAFGRGAAHGFDTQLPSPGSGTYQVCVYAINVGPGANVLVGCRNITTAVPFGTVDRVRREPGGIGFLGWAIDPDTANPVDVHLYVGTTGTSGLASLSRGDIAAAYPAYGANHGFDRVVPANEGHQSWCAYAINSGPGTNKNLACGSIDVAVNPYGYIDLIQKVSGGTRIAGWAIDPDTANPVDVHLYVGTTGTSGLASLSRGDIAAAYPAYGPNHGFDRIVPVDPTGKDVCAYAINQAAGTTTLLGCRRL